jgi:hypothetical protein
MYEIYEIAEIREKAIQFVIGNSNCPPMNVINQGCIFFNSWIGTYLIKKVWQIVKYSFSINSPQ